MVVAGLLKKIWPRRIRTQLILGIALIHVILMSLFVISMVDRQKKFFLTLNHDRATAVSMNFANGAAQFLVSYELVGLQKLVTTYKNVPGLEYAFVTADDGTVLTHTDKKYLGYKASDSISAKLKPIKSTQILLEDNSIIDIATPILNNDQIIGYARLGLSQKYIEPSLAEIRERGILYILISLSLVCLFTFIVADGLSNGLQKLVSASKKISEGNKDFRVSPSKSLEISELGTAFNQMLDEINADEKLLSLVLNNMPVAVWIVDEKGKVLSLNPAGIEMWKGVEYVGVEEYNIYKGWFTDTGKELRTEDWGIYTALTEGKSVINQEIEIECFDKSRKIILSSAIPLRDNNEKLIGGIAINVDITERKKGEAVLKDSEERRRLMISSALDAIISIDAEGKVTSWNPQAEKIFGWTEEEILGKALSDTIIPSKYKDAHDSGMKYFLQSGQHKVLNKLIELTAVNKNNIEFPVELNIVPIVQGRSTFFTAFIRDITERKKAEDDLREINHEINERVKELNCLYRISELTNDPHKTIDDILQECVDIIPNGYQYPEYTCARIIFEGKIFKTANFQETSWKLKADIIKKDILIGKVAVYYTHQMPEADEGPFLKEERLLINSIADMLESSTDRKNSERELKESNEKFKSLVEETPVGVFILQDKMIVYANPGFEKISGYSQNDLINKMSFEELIHEEDLHWVAENYELRITGKISSGGYMLRAIKKDGTIIFVEIIVARFIFNNEPAIIGSVIDKTRQVEEEKRISRAVTDAQEKERTEIGMELHDNVKQIMAASLMNLDYIKKNIDKKERSIEIIDDVKAYINSAIVELRRLSHQLAPSVDDNTGTLIEKIEKLIQDTKIADKKNVHLDIEEFNNPIKPEMQLAFYRILQEQFSNIMKHSKASAITIKIKHLEGYLYMVIKDDGIGFDSSLKKDGIGLENIKRRINTLNGHTEIVSAPGKGCEVKVWVPLTA
ncbi:MAG: PAS domain S-box protein [Bacteroidota bacterium]